MTTTHINQDHKATNIQTDRYFVETVSVTQILQCQKCVPISKDTCADC